MTDVTLWLERAPGQGRELRTAEVLRSRVSVRAPFSPLLFFLPDDGVLLRDVEGTLHVSNTTRKGTGKLVGYKRRSCPLASISLLCITYFRASLTTFRMLHTSQNQNKESNHNLDQELNGQGLDYCKYGGSTVGSKTVAMFFSFGVVAM